MKILIINPPIRLTDKPRHLPHGLAILANLIRKKLSIVPEFIDINARRYSLQEVESLLRSKTFDVVLIGGLIPVYKRIIVYSELIKKINPKAVIIAGGSAAMSVPELLLNNSTIDAVCAGEGERVIIDLLEGLEKNDLKDLTNVRGFYFKINDEIVFSGKPELLKDLDSESDVLAYDLLPMDIYLSNPCVGFGRDVDFISSRGCPFKCTFCYQPWGRKFRSHSVDFILDALIYLKKIFGIDFVSFQDDEFMADSNRVLKFCDKVQNAIPGLLWSCTGRVNLVYEDLVAAMREAGCVSISYGFESGSPRMLESMNKMATIEQMERAVELNRKYNMLVPVSFIIGMPGEDTESCKDTVEFCIRNNLHLNSLMFATPYPGTKLFDFAVKTGRIDAGNIHKFVSSLEDARDFTVNLTDAFSDTELIAKRNEMIREVSSKIRKISSETYERKLRHLFGNLIDEFIHDDAFAEHRSKHGGVDIF